LQDS